MRRLERLLRVPWLPYLVAVAPVVVAVSRALARDWIPVGDNAYFTIRARDVLTEHHPLVGAWSSGSDAVGVDVNNLGPLQLDLLAPFVRVFGFGAGTALGVAAVNVASVAMVVWFAQRRLGALGAWLGAAMSVAVAWTLGSELLFEPRQHHALVLPFLALLVGIWSLLRGDHKALPASAVAASLLAQTHLTFAVPTLALAVIGAAGALLATWADDAPDRWRSWRTPLIVTLVALAACWAQPLVEELQAGQGNISALREAAAAESDSLGAGRAVRAVATVVAPPDGWWRPSFRGFDPQGALMGAAPAAAALAALAAAHLVLAWLALRRRDRAVASWLVTSLVAVAVSVLAAATSPTSGPFGAVSGNYRYLWPVGAFATFGVVAALLRLLPRRVGPWPLLLPAAAALVFVVAAVPTSYQSPGPEDDAPLMPVARALREQLLDRDLRGPLALDRSGLFFGEPYSYVVLAALQENGVDLVLDAPTDISRFGDGRRRDGPVRGTVTLAVGDEALQDRPGSDLLARASSDDAPADRGTVAVWLEPAGP